MSSSSFVNCPGRAYHSGMAFTHLHVHSHFTLLGATASPAELAARAAAEGLTHLALTDTNALYGAVAFARACRDAGVQPIIGMTLTVRSPRGHAGRPVPDERIPGQLVLLAQDPTGYRSLCRISSLIQGSPKRETLAARGLDWETLNANRAGLICLDGGRLGWVQRHLRVGDVAAAQVCAGRLAGIFDENAYLSLEIHRPGDEVIAARVDALAKRLGLSAVAIHPIYCLEPGEGRKLQLLAAIRLNCRLTDLPAAALPDRGDPNVSLHWLTAGEMAARYAAFPEAVARTEEIAARCGAVLPAGGLIWPRLDLPAGQTPDQALARLSRAGLSERYGPKPSPEIVHRLEKELAIIAQHGYAPLFLVIADIIRYARGHEIPASTRGSVANSLVAYCAGITTVDPIKHGLIFERFLSPERADAPDIDMDFCGRRRDEVLAYVRQTYGPEHVALVGTVSTMRLQSAVRETAKAHGLDEKQIKPLVARMPRRWHPDPRRRDARTKEDVLAEIADPWLRDIVDQAYGIVGQPDHLSVHPGGVVITPGPLTDTVPVQWAPKGFLITQFDHKDLEAIGLPKLDLLGIRALTVLADAAELIRWHYDPGFKLADIPLDDAETAELIARGETIGVFQCESEGAQRTLRQLQARSVADLAVANAFFKPGPAMGGMAGAFVRRYRGEEPVTYLHPALEPILGHTKGVLIFQEQILRIATEIAGLTWAQADQLRRGMSRFREADMSALRDRFIAGCQRPEPDGPGFSPAQAERLWEQVIPFAGYGFNQGHATAYADTSYRCAYLKTHYPAAFLAARLGTHGGFHHPAIYIAEARRFGIRIRPPHVNHSAAAFTLETPVPGETSVTPERFGRPVAGPQASTSQPQPPTLWMGLGQIRDLRRRSVAQIVSQQQRRPFRGLRDLLSRVDLQEKEVRHLVQCGALDGLGQSRAAMMAEAEVIRRAGSILQMAFEFARPDVPPETATQRLAWEEHILGMPVSVNPLDLVRDRLPQHVTLARLPAAPGRRVTVVGYRLPGWTGGRGFFLGDGTTFVIVKGEEDLKAPPSWQPLVIRGRWVGEPYGTAWLQAEMLALL